MVLNKYGYSVLVLASAILVLTGCVPMAALTPVPGTVVVTAVPPTPTAVPVAASAVPAATVAGQPGASTPVTRTLTLSADGGNAAGSLGPNQAADLYQVSVEAGQRLSAHVQATSQDVTLGIYGPDGKVMSELSGATGYDNIVPSSGAYQVLVRNFGAAPADYALNVQVSAPTATEPPVVIVPPEVPTATAIPAPVEVPAVARQRIQFPAGKSSTGVAGQLAPSAADQWVLRAAKGQTLDLKLAFASGQAILVIWGADGTVLMSDHAGATAFNGVLPLTEDYNIDVRNVADGPTAYTLQVTIPPLPTPTATATPAPSVRRIQFATGATTAVQKGSLPAHGSNRWVLRALAGQTMTVDLAAPAGPALVIIWGADGNVLISDHAEATHWSGLLPTTQDYYIDVRSADVAVNYTLTVKIPPKPAPGLTTRRIRFAAGATSATVSSTVAGNGLDRWVLRLQAGQTLNVTVTPAVSDAAVLVVFGADGTVLMSDHAGSLTFSGVLPRTQDYNLDVKGAGSGTAYTLTVTVPPL